jgi:MFS transporter, DHA1 family, tetracycline resistance protein
LRKTGRVLEPEETVLLETPPNVSQTGGPAVPRRAALTFVFITIVLDMIGFGIITPVLSPLILNFTGGQIAEASLMAGIFGSVWALMQFVFSPLLGVVSDRFGRRPVILISVFGLGLDYIVMALAPNLGWLFVGRVVSGISAATMVTAGAYIADVTPVEKRAAGFGIIGAAFGIGFIVGPALGGLGAHFGLRVPFWIAAALSLVNGLYGIFVLPESLPREKRVTRLDWSRANPLGSLRLLRSHPELFGLAASNFIAYVAHQSFGVYVLYTIYRYAWGAELNGLSLALVGVVSVIVSLVLVKRSVARFGERGTLLLGLAFATVGFATWALSANVALLWIGIVLVSLWGLATPATQSIMSQHVEPHEQGQLQGAINSLRGLATLIGPILFAWVFAAFIDEHRAFQFPGAPWALAASLLVVALTLAAVATRARRPIIAQAQEA